MTLLTLKNQIRLGLFLSLMISTWAYAETKNTATLTIQPDTCIVNYQGDECQLDIQSSWQADGPVTCCLYIDNNEHSCWKQQEKGEKQLHLEINDSVQINLVNSDNKAILASQQLSIQALNSKRYRRRLKMPWSVF